jgi:hypothetical protein
VRGALIAVFLLACDTPGSRQGGGPPVDFTIGGIAFHLSSGVTVLPAGGGITFDLSDQPDTCLALQLVPVGTAITFSLHVALPSDGSTHATVVTKPSPGPGEATGSLSRATGGKQDTSLTASDGTVSWTVNAGGSTTLDSIDVGFSGTSGRLTTSGLTLPACTP